MEHKRTRRPSKSITEPLASRIVPLAETAVNQWEEPDVRGKALAELSDFVGELRALLAVFVVALDDREEANRHLAYRTLASICPDLQERVPSLPGAISETADPQVRMDAIREVVRIFPAVKDSIAARRPGWRVLAHLTGEHPGGEDSSPPMPMHETPAPGDDADSDKEGAMKTAKIGQGPTRAAEKQRAEEFVRFYPVKLPERLAWLADHLPIERWRFLRMMGLAPEQVKQHLDSPWEAVATQWPEQASWVEMLLRQLIDRFHYNWQNLAMLLREQAFRGKLTPLLRTPADDRERVMLSMIAEGGPDVSKWLLEYLSQPTEVPASS